ncbi:hypothetical protein BDA96_09G068200 [Sorghum bicolor]|uniref:Uncharacterized protein n=2 Tax=Sorghum bicolor TaxID=4558 RepID=A0A1Z5R189_SORBI|nr:hypothetical protein BDA96_09G068200 [Sorghum bicolor]OQU77543.1 hypothetical protein SORBI_3009G064832 [Sorghum bicolor]OQU77544.1 hypothetical protein SORBI_3009G064832 [Sorghum bicolor]
METNPHRWKDEQPSSEVWSLPHSLTGGYTRDHACYLDQLPFHLRVQHPLICNDKARMKVALESFRNHI